LRIEIWIGLTLKNQLKPRTNEVAQVNVIQNLQQCPGFGGKTSVAFFAAESKFLTPGTVARIFPITIAEVVLKW
jgi:hypothetical protein